VPQQLIDNVRSESREFFALPIKEKEAISMENSPAFRGYQRHGENITQGQQDLHEAVDWYKVLPRDHPEFDGELNRGENQWPDPARLPQYRPTFTTYTEELLSLGNAVMRGIALGLGLPMQHFEPAYRDSYWGMRSIYYPAQQGRSEGEGGLGCGEHTDYGCLTMVNQDNVAGSLQVRNRGTAEWMAADHIEGTFVMNIGEMLKIWTNGMYQSTPHRVVQSPDVDRVSVPFFFEPNFDTVISPLEICGPPKFQPISYGEHLLQKCNGNFTFSNFTFSAGAATLPSAPAG